VQAGYQVEGEWDWPDFKPRQWVRTNVSYGYGCACLQLRVNKENRHVLEIKSAQAQPLGACRSRSLFEEVEAPVQVKNGVGRA